LVYRMGQQGWIGIGTIQSILPFAHIAQGAI
jgi:hypothetical protein